MRQSRYGDVPATIAQAARSINALFGKGAVTGCLYRQFFVPVRESLQQCSNGNLRNTLPERFHGNSGLNSRAEPNTVFRGSRVRRRGACE